MMVRSGQFVKKLLQVQREYGSASSFLNISIIQSSSCSLEKVLMIIQDSELSMIILIIYLNQDIGRASSIMNWFINQKMTWYFNCINKMEHQSLYFKYKNKNSMEKVLACRRDRNLYLSGLRQKKHHRQANHIKAVYQDKIIKLLNFDANIAAIVGLATNLQLTVNRKYRDAFTKIETYTIEQSHNDLNKYWCEKSNSKQVRQYLRKPIYLGLNYMKYTIEKNQKNRQMEGWVTIKRTTKNEQKIHKFVILLDKVVLMRTGFCFERLKFNINQSQSLDFFDISAIEPKGTHKDSFQIGNEEMNTEESSLRITNKRQTSSKEVQEVDKIESDLVNLRKKLKKKEAKNRELTQIIQNQNYSHSKVIQELRDKLHFIKEQQKQEAQKKMKPTQNESKMMVLGKYMGLCLELQEKISLSVEILQQIFESQRHWEIHPQLNKFLRPYLQKIKQQNNIGQNCDIV